jgi:hypothetical protein
VDETPIPEHWRPAVVEVVRRLIGRDFDGLNADGLLDPALASDSARFAYWIDRYPASLVDLPDDVWAVADRTPMPDRPDTWWVVVPLWTAEEGRSDLSLEAYVVDDSRGIRVILHDAHVM